MRTKGVSPMRLLEALQDRFGAFEAIAYASLAMADNADKGGNTDWPMDRLTADAILEFGSDLRDAGKASMKWAEKRGIIPKLPKPEK